MNRTASIDEWEGTNGRPGILLPLAKKWSTASFAEFLHDLEQPSNELLAARGAGANFEAWKGECLEILSKYILLLTHAIMPPFEDPTDTVAKVHYWTEFVNERVTVDNPARFEHLSTYAAPTVERWQYIGFPNRVDNGVDLVAETKKGRFIAVQVKNVAAQIFDASRFGGQAFWGRFHQALWITSHLRLPPALVASIAAADRRSDPIRAVLGLTRLDLEKLCEPAFFIKLAEVLAARSAPSAGSAPVVDLLLRAKEPQTHQRECTAAVQTYWDEHAALSDVRGRIVMPCGAGKTLEAWFLARGLKARVVVVCVPSLYLLSQFYDDWARQDRATGTVSRYLLVGTRQKSKATCESDMDAACCVQLMRHQLTNGSHIRESITQFLAAPPDGGCLVVITTYHSMETLRKARPDDLAVDLMILDEAHRLAGSADKMWAGVLQQDYFDAKRRLFFTATQKMLLRRALPRDGLVIEPTAAIVSAADASSNRRAAAVAADTVFVNISVFNGSTPMVFTCGLAIFQNYSLELSASPSFQWPEWLPDVKPNRLEFACAELSRVLTVHTYSRQQPDNVRSCLQDISLLFMCEIARQHQELDEKCTCFYCSEATSFKSLSILEDNDDNEEDNEEEADDSSDDADEDDAATDSEDEDDAAIESNEQQDSASRINSMDDVGTFGRLLFGKPWEAAIREKILCDFRVVTPCVSAAAAAGILDDELFINRRPEPEEPASNVPGSEPGLADDSELAAECESDETAAAKLITLNLDGGRTLITGSRAAVMAVLILKRMFSRPDPGKLPISHVLTYHRIIPNAVNFAKVLNAILKSMIDNREAIMAAAKYLEIPESDDDVFIESLSGKDRRRNAQPPDARDYGNRVEQVIDTFKRKKWGVICNCKLFTEGVDIPIVIAVALVDSKSSVLELAQCFGRSLRQRRLADGTPNENPLKIAEIFIPATILPENCKDATRLRDACANARAVLGAIRETDSGLVEYFKALKSRMLARAAGEHVDAGCRRMADRLICRVLITDEMGTRDIEEDLINDRDHPGIIEFITLLEKASFERLGFPWDVMRGALKDFFAQNGRLPEIMADFGSNERRLAAWMHDQRGYLKRGELAEGRRLSLDALADEGVPGVWGVDKEIAFHASLKALVAVYQSEKLARPGLFDVAYWPTPAHPEPRVRQLGTFLFNTRRAARIGRLAPARKEAMNALEQTGISGVWGSDFSNQWGNKCDGLFTHFEKNGTLPTSGPLATWLLRNRRMDAVNRTTEAKRKALDALEAIGRHGQNGQLVKVVGVWGTGNAKRALWLDRLAACEHEWILTGLAGDPKLPEFKRTNSHEQNKLVRWLLNNQYAARYSTSNFVEYRSDAFNALVSKGIPIRGPDSLEAREADWRKELGHTVELFHDSEDNAWPSQTSIVPHVRHFGCWLSAQRKAFRRQGPDGSPSLSATRIAAMDVYKMDGIWGDTMDRDERPDEARKFDHNIIELVEEIESAEPYTLPTQTQHRRMYSFVSSIRQSFRGNGTTMLNDRRRAKLKEIEKKYDVSFTATQFEVDFYAAVRELKKYLRDGQVAKNAPQRDELMTKLRNMRLAAKRPNHPKQQQAALEELRPCGFFLDASSIAENDWDDAFDRFVESYDANDKWPDSATDRRKNVETMSERRFLKLDQLANGEPPRPGVWGTDTFVPNLQKSIAFFRARRQWPSQAPRCKGVDCVGTCSEACKRACAEEKRLGTWRGNVGKAIKPPKDGPYAAKDPDRVTALNNLQKDGMPGFSTWLPITAAPIFPSDKKIRRPNGYCMILAYNRARQIRLRNAARAPTAANVLLISGARRQPCVDPRARLSALSPCVENGLPGVIRPDCVDAVGEVLLTGTADAAQHLCLCDSALQLVTADEALMASLADPLHSLVRRPNNLATRCRLRSLLFAYVREHGAALFKAYLLQLEGTVDYPDHEFMLEEDRLANAEREAQTEVCKALEDLATRESRIAARAAGRDVALLEHDPGSGAMCADVLVIALAGLLGKPVWLYSAPTGGDGDVTPARVTRFVYPPEPEAVADVWPTLGDFALRLKGGHFEPVVVRFQDEGSGAGPSPSPAGLGTSALGSSAAAGPSRARKRKIMDDDGDDDTTDGSGGDDDDF